PPRSVAEAGGNRPARAGRGGLRGATGSGDRRKINRVAETVGSHHPLRTGRIRLRGIAAAKTGRSISRVAKTCPWHIRLRAGRNQGNLCQRRFTLSLVSTRNFVRSWRRRNFHTVSTF